MSEKKKTEIKLAVEYLDTNKLIPYARNAKTHSPEQVAAIAGSMREFGFNNPVLIDPDNGIIAGHGRVLAAQKLELAEIPCVRLGHMTEAQKRAYIIADNKLSEYGSAWDDKMLALELGDLVKELPDFNFENIGIDTEGMQDILKDMPTLEVGEVATKESDSDISLTHDCDVCPLVHRMDVVTGRCSFGCKYCFALKGPAAQACKGAQVKSEKAIRKAMISVPDNGIWVTGTMMDPSLAGNRLGWAVKHAQERNIATVIQTKNPVGVVKYLEAEKVDFTKISVKIAFSIFGNADIEPNAPTIDERYDGAKLLSERGAGIVLRQQPWIIEHDGERYQEFLEKFAALGCDRFVCEPIRWSACWKPYLPALEAAVGDGFSLSAYFEKYGTGFLTGPLHWETYDTLKLRDIYKAKKAEVAKHGMKFGICSGVLGIQNCDLNDGEICCGVKQLEGRPYDELSINSMVQRGVAGRYIFKNAPKTQAEYDLFIQRVDQLNLPSFPLHFDVKQEAGE